MEKIVGVILICLTSVAPPDCNEKTAVDVLSNRVASELDCTRGWQEVIGRSALRDEVGRSAYVKTFCRRVTATDGDPAAALTVKEIATALVRATPAAPADFARQNLRGLDLSGLDFAHARLAEADFSMSDLSDVNLAGSDLAGARLDRAVVLRANFAHADLSQASLLRLVTSSTLQPQAAEAANFAGADLSRASIFARLNGADLSGARLVGAHLGVDERTPKTMNLMRTELSGCDLSGADLRGADLHGVLLSFAKLAGADLSGADLRHADLTGADLTGADLTDADLGGAVLRDVRGLARAHGLDGARNRDRIVP